MPFPRGGGTHHQHDHAHVAAHDAAPAELLDLEAAVLHGYLADVLDWVAGEAADPARIVDLGAGTGTGTLALAARFPAARLLAVDASADLRDRLRAKVRDLGLADRITTVEADLDAGWPIAGPVDLVWAAMSLHHLADPGRVLAEAFAAIRPGGLLAVAEAGDDLRFLPDDVGAAVEARLLAAFGDQRAHALPEFGARWADRLTAAGFAPVTERSFSIDLRPPLPPETARYAWLWLGRMRSALADRLSDGDRAVLDALVDGDGPEALVRRADLRVRGSRVVTLGRRPG